MWKRQKSFYIAAGKAKCYSYFGKQLISSSNGSRVTIWPSNSTGRHTLKGNENICLHKHLHKNVYSSVIYNCPEVETTQMALTDELIKKKSGIAHTVAYYSATKRNKILILATTWMDLKNFMLKWKTVTKNDILYDFMYMKFPEEANL